MKPYRLSAIADEDLFSIFLHTARVWGEQQVGRYLGRIDQAFEMLATSPFAAGSRARDDLATRCRSFRIGMHVIFYHPENAYLAIARILHSAMDFEHNVTEEHFP